MSDDEFEYQSPVLGAAIAMHEMFTTLMQAGFTEKQALYIITEIFKNSTQQ